MLSGASSCSHLLNVTLRVMLNVDRPRGRAPSQSLPLSPDGSLITSPLRRESVPRFRETPAIHSTCMLESSVRLSPLPFRIKLLFLRPARIHPCEAPFNTAADANGLL